VPLRAIDAWTRCTLIAVLALLRRALVALLAILRTLLALIAWTLLFTRLMLWARRLLTRRLFGTLSGVG
jgi:hypothetical protein